MIIKVFYVTIFMIVINPSTIILTHALERLYSILIVSLTAIIDHLNDFTINFTAEIGL